MLTTVGLDAGAGKASSSAWDAMEDFVGSAQVLALALENVFEDGVLKKLPETGVSLSQMRVLKLVARSKAETVSDVAAFQGVSNAAASKTIDRLVRRRLLKRSEGEEDRRASELSLTRNGRSLLDGYEYARRHGLESIFEAFAAADLKNAVDLLDRLTASIVAHSVHPDGVCLQCHVFRHEKCAAGDVPLNRCFYQRRKSRKGRPQ